MMKTVGIILAALFFIAPAALAQCIEPCQPFVPDPGPGDGEGGGGWECLYCYKDLRYPYANCYSAAYSNDPKYSNCNGTQICYNDASGNQYCEPFCEGNQCFLV